jgi:transposase InsO family protein
VTPADVTPADVTPADHAQHLQELAHLIDRHDQHPDDQLEYRVAERSARAAAAALVDASHPQADVARALHLAPQTRSTWMNHPADATPTPSRGRPPAPLDPIDKAAVNELLDSQGSSIGVPSLKRLFPAVTRAALHNLRDRWDHEHEIEPAHLVWSTPGSVWTADFTETPVPVDGIFDHVLLVRDLASHFILLAAPCAEQSAEVVMLHCRQLFRRHGAPLVLKTDNGSAFIATETRAHCREHGVLNLLSPPLTPQYNGCIEASAGQFKTRVATLARLHACDTWTSDILEAARHSANALAGIKTLSAPSSAEQWRDRKPIETERRAVLAALVEDKTTKITQSIQRERAQKGLPIELRAACRATVARTATRQALVELGYLLIRRPANTSTQSKPGLSRN